MNFAVAWSDALLRASWQAGLAAVITWAILKILPGISANIRSWVWRLVALKFLFTPMIAIPVASENVSVVTESGGHPTPLALGVALLSGLGALNVLYCVLADMRAIVSARRVSTAVDRTIIATAREIGRDIGLSRTPRIWQAEVLTVPALIGFVRPTILLPIEFLSSATQEDIRMVLAHELAHVRRRDLGWSWVGVFLRSVFFFHPLAWFAWREAQAADEAACDAIAIDRLGVTRRQYGRLILRLATREPFVAPLAAAASGSGDSVKRRIDALAHPRQANWTVSALCLLTAILALPGYRPVSLPILPTASPKPSTPTYIGTEAMKATKLGWRAPIQETH